MQVGSIIRDNRFINDKSATTLCQEISKVNDEIRIEVLQTYVTKCKQVYNIAFIQWRSKFPSKVKEVSKEEKEKCILKRINQMKKHTHLDKQKVMAETLEAAELNSDFLLKFQFADNEEELKPFNINSFKQIGLSDPFPDDDNHV